MKNISIVILSLLILASCGQNQPKEYLTLSGKVINNTGSLISIVTNSGAIKTFNINKDGTFKDTLKIAKSDIYGFQLSAKKTVPIHLENGYNLNIAIDATNFATSFKFSGNGATNNNYFSAQFKNIQKLFQNAQSFLRLQQDDFKQKITARNQQFDSIVNAYQNVDSTLISNTNIQFSKLIGQIESLYNSQLANQKGNPSPKFVDYLDIKGGKKSLDSFKGRYVYIDVWATWCGPCIQQIPYLQKMEKEYHKKNITFVSISTDGANRNGGSWEAAEKKWRNFVYKKQMTGVQLWSGEDYSFQQAYQITGIPRFILIDPNGNIINANAPRPSDPNLKTLFTSLGI